jgi:hypothetical protein
LNTYKYLKRLIFALIINESIAKAQDWVKSNYKLLRKHRGEWIAYNAEDGIIAHDKSADVVAQAAEVTQKWHVLRYVNPWVFAGLRRV